MDFKLILSKDAHYDIAEIHGFIAADKPDAADKVVLRIFEALDNLVIYPGMGGSVAERYNAETDYRYFTVSPYVYIIFYRINGNSIEISRILDGRRDCITVLGL